MNTPIEFTKGHRLSFGLHGFCQCHLCNATAIDLAALEQCKATDDERQRFDARFTPASVTDQGAEETAEFSRLFQPAGPTSRPYQLHIPDESGALIILREGKTFVTISRHQMIGGGFHFPQCDAETLAAWIVEKLNEPPIETLAK